jgi:hypothetical protein
MPIDPSIALIVRPLQLANPLEQFGQLQQARAAMSQNRLADLVFGEKERELGETRTLNNLYKGALGADGALNRNKLLGDVAGAGLGSRLPGLQKGFQDLDKGQADISKTQADADKAKADALGKKLDLAGQTFGYVRANPTIENANSALDYLVSNGVFTPQQGAQYRAQVAADPTKVAQLADQAFRSALSAKDQLASFQTRNTGGSTDTVSIDPVTGQAKIVNSVKNTQSPDSVASVAATKRGQDMADVRAREQNALGKVPSGYRQGPDGTLVAIPGGPADPKGANAKQPTEFQGKSAAFGARAEQADKIISGLDGQYSPAKINTKAALAETWGIGGMLGSAGNMMLSPENQKAEQAQRDFINAVLRQESGAAIGASEFDNARKQYFPQPGDGAGVIQQKAANRKLAIQGLQSNAGRAAFSAPAAAAPAKPQQKGGLPAGWSVEVH